MDYETIADLTLTFQPGETSGSVNFAIIDDSIFEVDESLVVQITAAQSATIGAPSEATVTISDDDCKYLSH